MMRHRLGDRIALALLAGVLSLSTPASAEPGGSIDGIGGKLLRGTVNVTTGWAELFKQPYSLGTRKGWLVGVARGPFDGLGMFVARTLGGVYEILTFPVPVPPRYAPMVRPDYVWQPDSGRFEPDRGRSGHMAPARTHGTRVDLPREPTEWDGRGGRAGLASRSNRMVE